MTHLRNVKQKQKYSSPHYLSSLNFSASYNELCGTPSCILTQIPERPRNFDSNRIVTKTEKCDVTKQFSLLERAQLVKENGDVDI